MGQDEVTYPGDSQGIATSPSAPRNDGTVSSPDGDSVQRLAEIGHALFEKLKLIVASRTRDVFALGAILKEIRDRELYLALGYETFLEFCADPDLAFRKSTAYTYIQLHETFILKYKLDFQNIGNIPYTKLVLVMKYADSGNVRSMIEMARAMAIGDLDEEIEFQGLKTDADGQAVEYQNPGIKLFDRYKRLQAADRGDFDREYRRWNKIPG